VWSERKLTDLAVLLGMNCCWKIKTKLEVNEVKQEQVKHNKRRLKMVIIKQTVFLFYVWDLLKK